MDARILGNVEADVGVASGQGPAPSGSGASGAEQQLPESSRSLLREDSNEDPVKVFENVAKHAKACADTGKIPLLYKNDQESFEFWAGRFTTDF